jgi:hypothetical protein
LDATTTVIDGDHIITRTIDASKIAVKDLSALNATIGGWVITAARLIKEVKDQSGVVQTQVYIQAPENPADSNLAFAVRKHNGSALENKFYVAYSGKLYAENADIKGKITADSGKIGGVSITNGVLSGIKDINIFPGGVSGGSGGSLGNGTVNTWNTVDAINSSLDWADEFGSAAAGGGSYYTGYFRANYLRAGVDLEVGSWFTNLGTLRVNGPIVNGSWYMYMSDTSNTLHLCSLQRVVIDGTTYHLLGYNG